MAIADPRLHIICGICGNNKELYFDIVPGEYDEPVDVYIYCRNCASLSGLSEIMPMKHNGYDITCVDCVDYDKGVCCCYGGTLELDEEDMPTRLGICRTGRGKTMKPKGTEPPKAEVKEEQSEQVDLNKLQHVCQNIAHLLQHREPGIMSWCGMLGTNVNDLRVVLGVDEDEEDNESTSPKAQYEFLERKLKLVRLVNPDSATRDEDSILEEMDIAWTALSQEERDAVNKVSPRTEPTMVDVDVNQFPGSPVRIVQTPDAEEPLNHHTWFAHKTYNACTACGVLRNSDSLNTLCPGKVPLTLREEPEEVKTPYYACCGNCATPRRHNPVAGNYKTCPHIAEAIEESEFDVSPSSRICKHHSKPETIEEVVKDVNRKIYGDHDWDKR